MERYKEVVEPTDAEGYCPNPSSVYWSRGTKGYDISDVGVGRLEIMCEDYQEKRVKLWMCCQKFQCGVIMFNGYLWCKFGPKINKNPTDTLQFTLSPMVVCIPPSRWSKLCFMGGVYIYPKGHHPLDVSLMGQPCGWHTSMCVCAQQLMRWVALRQLTSQSITT